VGSRRLKAVAIGMPGNLTFSYSEPPRQIPGA